LYRETLCIGILFIKHFVLVPTAHRVEISRITNKL